MLRRLAFVLATMIITIATSTIASAEPDNKPLLSAIAMMRGHTVGHIAKKDTGDGGVQVVFLSQGNRYTFWYSGGKDPILSVWVRPNGTYTQKEIEGFTDEDLDGEVDFGISGKGETDAEKKLFQSEKFLDNEQPEGLEHKVYWNMMLQMAIRNALMTLKGSIKLTESELLWVGSPKK